MSDARKGQEILIVKESDENINAPTQELNSILVKIQLRLTKLEGSTREAVDELEDQIAEYRAEGSKTEKRHNQIVDILLRVIRDQGERINELAE